MKAIFILLLILCFFKVKGQNKDSEQFINNFYKGNDTIVYFQIIDKFTLTQLEKIVLKDSLSGIFEDYDKKFSLTRSERSQIKQELDQMQKYHWSSKLFNKIQGIAVDPDSINKNLGQNKIVTFSKPIFIREKTYCLFYNGYSCGSRCGQGRFILYKRMHKKWVPYIILYKWIA
ncbi:hypothetical protein EV200_1166 [Pedobacter psychrotolerans]|uniref:Uncharacterized protein n=1 Tax=Pedobacter psychrotolerans TaxID=1843235 RepID=A0A4R2GZW0_9SPHI|nr:hypothetical protein [Pedobacter psychrotolerans]TCO17543.1 hypothetical protein EV200_1166 [Pedobacter psychrotolerans]GGE71325.1 hypothetical protein GCM10011413_42620 [Pedobacter psychrotolerans]